MRGRRRYRTAGLCRPVGSKYPSAPASRRLASACGPASELSPDDTLEHLSVQRQVSDDLLQSGVLILQSLQSTHLIGQQTRILLAPIEIGRLANTSLPANLCHRHAVVALLQNERLLASENFDAFMLPLRLPAGRLSRKTPIMKGLDFGDQSMDEMVGPEGLEPPTKRL